MAVAPIVQWEGRMSLCQQLHHHSLPVIDWRFVDCGKQVYLQKVVKGWCGAQHWSNLSVLPPLKCLQLEQTKYHKYPAVARAETGEIVAGIPDVLMQADSWRAASSPAGAKNWTLIWV